MANTANWIFLMIFYFAGVSLVVGLLAQGGVLDSTVDISTNPDIHSSYTPIYQATDYLLPGVPVCTANGSLNFEEPDTLLFTYDPDDITLSSECINYCRNETAPFLGFISTYAISCPNACANLTDYAGENHLGCAPEDDRWNFLTGILGFYFFQIDLGIGAYSWVITLIFIYIPLLMFGLILYYSLRSGN